MAKNPQLGEQSSLQAAAALAAQDELAALLKPAQAKAQELFAAGHHTVIDRRADGRISVHMATDADAFANLLVTVPTDPTKAGTRYLAKTEGKFGGVPIIINGQLCYLRAEIQLAKTKEDAKS